MEHCYHTKIKFIGRYFSVYILTKEEDQFDLHIEVTGSLCGDDFILLRKYLMDEGYVDAAREWNKSLIKI